MTVTLSASFEANLPPLCNRHQVQMAGAWNRPETWFCDLCGHERDDLCNAVDALIEFLANYDDLGDDLFQIRRAREVVAAVRAK